LNADGLMALSLIAATFTSLSMTFQTRKVLKSRQTRDISLMMYIMLMTGLILWLVYGFCIQDPALIIANIVAGVCAGVTLFCKIKWEHFAK
jgi:MtN3 and saliva related transmembrane protein